MKLITGATGKLGHHVLDHLLDRVPAGQLVAGVRDPAKAAGFAARGVQVRKLDYTQPATLDAALDGITEVLLISSNDLGGQRAEHHAAVIAAAKRAKVRLLAYTSILHGEASKMQLAADHQATERTLRASGVPFVLLRNGWYIENYTDNLGAALAHGAMLGAAGDGKVAPAARNDFAEAAAVVLTTPGHEGKVYELAGDRSYTLAEIAAEVARASGKPVVYRDLPVAEYAGALTSFGLPAPFASILADSDVGIARGDLDDASGDLRRLIGRATTPLGNLVIAAVRAA
jgi:NAD(P)H dehydrogenase (quinone)